MQEDIDLQSTCNVSIHHPELLNSAVLTPIDLQNESEDNYRIITD